MKVLVACDKYKGSLSALEVAQAIERGFGPGFEVELCPIADGGEGFVEAMLGAMRGERVSCLVQDALGRGIEVSYGRCRSLAIIEMAEASGLWRIAEKDRDVMKASTFGTGQMIRHAVECGAERILLGLGGSATNDGGAGMAGALGWRFFGTEGEITEIHPSNLVKLERVDGSEAMAMPRIEVACDVENPVFGERGATAIYGPQKGAGPMERALLETILKRIVSASGGEELAEVPGAGAAGALGWGLMKFAGAELRPGFEMVAEAVNLRERIRNADVVITGEGSLDAQSLEGKGPVGVARMAREEGKRVCAIAGQITPEVREAGVFDEGRALLDTGHPVEELIANAARYTEDEARILAGMLIG